MEVYENIEGVLQTILNTLNSTSEPAADSLPTEEAGRGNSLPLPVTSRGEGGGEGQRQRKRSCKGHVP